ncbi:hypothetical protein Nepgr_019584 [Nepenthes gracilis]|uniref:Uncharacterized protein n=1 Tax=Nepenthes gracilis TaxID=150966 RepID=A0AAD3XUI4_NEPGR|nr:hypothetical protein Nepgr_019584 [Nepenthes gracilis]
MRGPGRVTYTKQQSKDKDFESSHLTITLQRRGRPQSTHVSNADCLASHRELERERERARARAVAQPKEFTHLLRREKIQTEFNR